LKILEVVKSRVKPPWNGRLDIYRLIYN